MSSTIEGIDFIGDATNTGFFHIPPDPHGAVGPNHLVAVVNTSIRWHLKNGTLQSNQALSNFFASLAPVNRNLFNPKAIYDQYANRFLVVVLEKNDSGSNPNLANVSRILVAVSKDSNPNDGWWFTAINSKTVVSGTEAWANYPGFATDDKAVYITTNLFAFATNSFQGARLWIIDKGTVGGFYAGSPATVNQYDPPGATGGFAGTEMPAQVFGAGGVGATRGTFLVFYEGLHSGANSILQIIRVDDPLRTAGGPTFNIQFLNVGIIDNLAAAMPGAPQSGTATTVATNDRRALAAVWRNNALWVTTTVVPPSGTNAGRAIAHWFQINTSNLASLRLTQQGDVSGQAISPGAYTFFPSIAVNAAGDMAIGVAVSGPNIFPSAYYTGRRASDPAGTLQPASALATGLAFYIRTFGSGENRWGDFTATVVDPFNDSSFCVFNEYAIMQGNPTGGESGQWGTRWGCFAFSPPAIGCLPQPVNLGLQMNVSSASPTLTTTASITKLSGTGTCNLGPAGSSCQQISTTERACGFSKSDAGTLCRAQVQAQDTLGNSFTCDPVLTTLQISTGRHVSQDFTGIPQAEHLISVINGAPGLERLEILVNKSYYKALKLTDNQARTIDVAAAMQPGDSNTLQLAGAGETGDSATVIVGDTSVAGTSTVAAQFLNRTGADKGAWGPLAKASEDNTAQQAALASQQQVRLQLATELDQNAVTYPPLYTVQVNGMPVGVQQVVVASESPQGTTLLLNLPAGTLRVGDQVLVTWEELKNAQGQPLSGQVILVAK